MTHGLLSKSESPFIINRRPCGIFQRSYFHYFSIMTCYWKEGSIQDIFPFTPFFGTFISATCIHGYQSNVNINNSLLKRHPFSTTYSWAMSGATGTIKIPKIAGSFFPRFASILVFIRHGWVYGYRIFLQFAARTRYRMGDGFSPCI